MSSKTEQSIVQEFIKTSAKFILGEQGQTQTPKSSLDPDYSDPHRGLQGFPYNTPKWYV